MYNHRLDLGEVLGLFTLAGIPVLKTKPLIDQYGYPPCDPRYYETLPRCVWWFVKTEHGWVEIGWRHRVIQISWDDTPIRAIITNDDVTKSQTCVHAWSIKDALTYLKALASEMEKSQGS